MWPCHARPFWKYHWPSQAACNKAISAIVASSSLQEIINNVSLSEVLEGARWKCASTFSNHYLRDMSISTDGISKLGPIVVALRVFNT